MKRCWHDGCTFMVTMSGGGWAHVDTHGTPTDHPAAPEGMVCEPCMKGNHQGHDTWAIGPLAGSDAGCPNMVRVVTQGCQCPVRAPKPQMRASAPWGRDNLREPALSHQFADMVITTLGPNRARIERRGHIAEGVIEMTETGMRFDGHFVCGPHDESGNHEQTKEGTDA